MIYCHDMAAPNAGWPSRWSAWSNIQAGEPVAFPPFSDGETADVSRRRTVEAEWIIALVDPETGFVATPINLRNAIIAGDLPLRYVEFKAGITLANCEFQGAVDFDFATFDKSACFDGSLFAVSCSYYGAVAKADLELRETRFQDLDCSYLSVAFEFAANDIKVGGSANFGLMRVGGDLHLEQATFSGDAVFDAAKIESELDLSNTTFAATASFIGTHIKKAAVFAGIEVVGVAYFDNLIVEGDAHFERARFVPAPAAVPARGEAIRFPGLHVSLQAIFDEAVFGAASRFDQARFDGEAFFESARFDGPVRFDGAKFAGPAKFTRLLGVGLPVEFRGGGTFIGATAAQDVEFHSARFSGDLCFRDATFKTVYFQDTLTETATDAGQFRPPGEGTLDLRGFTYDRILVGWKDALRILEPYDVQPYRAMEKAIRTIGKDRDADGVYLLQRERALKYDWSHLGERGLLAIAGALYWCLRFGVRPLRLAVIPLVLLIFSIAIFHQRSAVVAKKDSPCVTHTLDYLEAFGVSVNFLLPVELPVAGCWQATPLPAFHFGEGSVSFSLWGTWLKITGWIFVPLGVAALSGLLRRDPPK